MNTKLAAIARLSDSIIDTFIVLTIGSGFQWATETLVGREFETGSVCRYYVFGLCVTLIVRVLVGIKLEDT